MRLADLLAATPVLDPVPDEPAYYDLWRTHCAQQEPFAMAVKGGVLSDRFGWIFAAGYQGAIRHVFPHEVFRGWAAFAVSEDRSERDPLPRVTWREERGQAVINGAKTWIASSALCSDIVFSARGEGRLRYFRVARDTPGLTIDTRPPGRVLPDMSQGSAFFEEVALMPADEVDAGRVGSFGAVEVLYVYAAFLASTWARARSERSAVEPLLARAADIARKGEVSWQQADMLALDAEVQQLLVHLRAEVFGDHDLWRRDYKLIAMYGRD